MLVLNYSENLLSKKDTMIPMSLDFKAFALGIPALKEMLVMRITESAHVNLDMDLMMMATV